METKTVRPRAKRERTANRLEIERAAWALELHNAAEACASDERELGRYLTAVKASDRIDLLAAIAAQE